MGIKNSKKLKIILKKSIKNCFKKIYFKKVSLKGLSLVAIFICQM